jgi:signal transduction histidine kinase
LVVAGRRTGPREEVDLVQLAAQRVGIIAPWAKERGVNIAVSGGGTASIDQDAIGRVIDNLVRNAVEASASDGAVQVMISNGGGDAHVVVADRGSGIDEAREHEIFEPFFTTKPDGTGLGLALSRAIASAHGGTLSYERRDGATRFDLKVPVKAEAAT